jgi:hypothetical protein
MALVQTFVLAGTAKDRSMFFELDFAFLDLRLVHVELCPGFPWHQQDHPANHNNRGRQYAAPA